MTTTPTRAATPAAPPAPAGTQLRRGLTNRHIQLIALGGAIGTGLFYGSGEAISKAGPAILLAYAGVGAIIFLVVRAMGEMSVDTPDSGAFSYYAHRNLGPFAGFVSGWNYWFNYVAVAMAELAVVGKYAQFWFPQLSPAVTSAACLVLITAVNLVHVKAFGEFEFWFALIKVVAIIAMIAFGLAIICFGWGNDGHATGIANLTAHGGFFPTGAGGIAASLVVVAFSFGGIELIGITAGEATNPRRSIPKAINQVIYRILIFYVGALFVTLALFPWNQLGEDSSPFVTIFAKLGIPAAASILNVVVITAAVSTYNSGLYSNGRMLHSLAEQGNAPRVLARVNRSGSPYVGVLVSSAITAVVVVLNLLLPGKVFPYVMSVAMIAAVINWSLIMITQLAFRRRIGAEAGRLAFKLPLYPVSNVIVLAFLAALVVLMAQNPDYRIAVFVGPIWLAILAIAYVARRSVVRR